MTGNRTARRRAPPVGWPSHGCLHGEPTPRPRALSLLAGQGRGMGRRSATRAQRGSWTPSVAFLGAAGVCRPVALCEQVRLALGSMTEADEACGCGDGLTDACGGSSDEARRAELRVAARRPGPARASARQAQLGDAPLRSPQEPNHLGRVEESSLFAGKPRRGCLTHSNRRWPNEPISLDRGELEPAFGGVQPATRGRAS